MLEPTTNNLNDKKSRRNCFTDLISGHSDIGMMMLALSEKFRNSEVRLHKLQQLLFENTGCISQCYIFRCNNSALFSSHYHEYNKSMKSNDH